MDPKDNPPSPPEPDIPDAIPEDNGDTSEGNWEATDDIVEPSDPPPPEPN